MMALSSRRALLCGIAVLPLAGGAATAEPSDLARACDWAARYRDWLNSAACGPEWTDEMLDAGMARHEAVFTRAVREPSRSLSDLRAKARLLLQDLENGGLGDEYNDDRLIRVLLKEVAAL